MATSNQRSRPLSSKNLFPYDRLPTSTSTRLLEILDSTDNRNQSEIVRCQLRVIDIDCAPTYAALSYTWGNPSPVLEATQVDGKPGKLYKIELNGHILGIKENLFEFLKAQRGARVRYHTKEDGFGAKEPCHLPIWVDALCINQEDLSELSHQVRLMGRIYQSAEVVVAWLGRGNSLINRACTCVRMLLEHMASMQEKIEDAVMGKPDPQKEILDSHLLLMVPGMTESHWISLLTLLESLWFQRAWVAQEAILSRDTVLIFGESMLHIDLLVSVLLMLKQNDCDQIHLLRRDMTLAHPSWPKGGRPQGGWHSCSRDSKAIPIHNGIIFKFDPRPAFSFALAYHKLRSCLGLSKAGAPVPYKKPGTGVNGVPLRWGLEEELEWNLSKYRVETKSIGLSSIAHPPLRLLSVLSRFRDLNASDPRDKVFAFLSIATDSTGILPDYTATVEAAYENTARKIILNTKTLAILSQVEDPSQPRLAGIPGWVPDFSKRLGRQPLDDGGEECTYCATADATGSTVPAIIELNSDRTLGVEGIKVDTVTSACKPDETGFMNPLQLALQVPSEYPDIPLAWWGKGFWAEMRRELRGRRISRIEAVWRTIVADNVIQRESEFDPISSWEGLGSGFRRWILVGILEAHASLVKGLPLIHQDVMAFIAAPFTSQMAVWSALYDEKQVMPRREWPELQEVFGDLNQKYQLEVLKSSAKDDETENSDNRRNAGTEGGQGYGNTQFQTSLDTEGHRRNRPEDCTPERCSRRHLPSASSIRKHLMRENNDEIYRAENIEHNMFSGSYKSRESQRLTALDALEKRQLRNFRKLKDNATRGRRLFCTSKGRLGLGPLSTNVIEGKADEVWILKGAKVPFILRHIGGDQYKLVGEAYVHGIMYGEKAGPFYNDSAKGTVKRIRIV